MIVEPIFPSNEVRVVYISEVATTRFVNSMQHFNEIYTTINKYKMFLESLKTLGRVFTAVGFIIIKVVNRCRLARGSD